MRVGIDLIEGERFANMAQSDLKLSTVFTEKERAYFKKFSCPNLHIAGTYAVKEAVVKAFKTGFDKGIVPLDIEVVHISDAPHVKLHGASKKFFEENKFSEIEVSITHNRTDACAICIIN